ncbi:MAG TPA: hypothetical protein VFH99_03725 [Candidatus Saccharimonadales bacterium]|nr:hypothetical protein [Candidatus Saccharimonadales bacterium]
MSKKQTPKVTIIGGGAEGNGGDGVHVEGNTDIYAKDFQSRSNAGKGFHIIRTKEDGRLRKWVLSVAGIVVGGLILAYIFGVGR